MQPLKLSILRRERDTGIRDLSARRLFNRIVQANNSLIRGGIRPSVKSRSAAESAERLSARQLMELRAHTRRQMERAARAQRLRALPMRFTIAPRDRVPGSGILSFEEDETTTDSEGSDFEPPNIEDIPDIMARST